MATTEEYTGADLTGSSGNTGRVLTLSNTQLTLSEGFLVFLNGQALTTSQYTATHNNTDSTIEFSVRVWDDQPIVVFYETTTSVSSVTYCNISDIRALTNISSTSVSDADLAQMISRSIAEINSELTVKVIRERVEYIDETRENDVDGSNTTYYVKNWKGKYLADFDGDGAVETDDITVYAVASDGTETEATVSSVTANQGKFVLSTAYASSYDLYVTYAYSHVDMDTPDPLVRLAAIYLVSAYAFLNRDAGIGGTIRFGNVDISTKLSDSYGVYYQRYKDTMKRLKAYSNLKDSWRESNVKI